MYREYSIVDDDTDDDAELIADVGYIASKIRILEQLHFRRYCEAGQDDNEDTLVSRIEDSFCKGLGSISCKRNNKIIEQQSRSSVDSVAALTTQLNTVQRRRILANLLIQFYEDHERAKQQIINSKDKNDIMNKSEAKQVVVDATTSNDDTTTTKSSSNTRFAENKSNHLKINENNDKVVTSRSEGNIGNFYHNKLGGGDVKVKAGGGDLKCCNSEISGSSIPKTGLKRAFKLIRLENTVVQYTFNDSDLKGLVKELKKKVEYAERMNWLCLSERQLGPPIRKYSLPKHQEVKKRFLEICDNIFSDEVKAALRLPAFDSYEWEDAEVIHLMQTMFTELGLLEKFNIPIITLREWLYEVYKHYNEVPFHNFRHCFCVAQMMYAITRQANLINRLGELEVLILLVSCICHDLDHPGYNNIYQINARTELALRYNDISPLENHHCSIAFRLLEHPDCNIFQNFNRETFNTIREGIIRCILATDMARHNEILTQFKEVIPIFDYSNRAHINLLCMVLIKVSDISNEARPMNIAEPWLDRLLQEFFAQSAAEKSQGLPVTPFMDPEKVSKPGSQVRFIGLVLLPLFEALGELLPELIDMIIIPVRVALDYYRRINDAQNKPRKSLAETAENSSDGGGGSGSPKLQRSQSGISVRSRRSIPSQKSASRTSVDEATCVAAELHDLPEDSESGDSETATEVDVAEKASKFKVDTESGNRSKCSHSTSRKSSREKRPSMISEMCSSGGRIRNSFGNIHGYQPNRSHFSSNRAVSLDQYSCNNRRLSDGLQQVISDSNVFYNHHNRSLDSEGQSAFSVEKQKIMGTGGGSKMIGEDVANNPPYEDSNSNKNILQQQTNNKGIPNISHPNSVCYSSHNGSKSWKTRFRQITEYFSFGFEKTNKRFSSTKSSPCSLRKNNADILKQQQQQQQPQQQQAQKQGTCCTLKYNISSRLIQRQEFSNVGRNRALSLDVPARQRYSSSSGGDSRKSSRNEDNSIKHDFVNEDSNSNNTSNGDPPSARMRGGSDETDQTVFLPKVITPSLDVEHSSALDYTKSLSGRSRGEEVNEGLPRI